VLRPEDWYDAHKSEGCYLWSPPPTAADATIELMAKSIHKRNDSTHIMVVPRLMTARWRKLLGKARDVMITIPVGTPVWPASEHEPLILAISFPLISHRPWRLRGSRLTDSLSIDLSDMWTEAFDGTGIVTALEDIGRRAEQRGVGNVTRRRKETSLRSRYHRMKRAILS
jgi:hypothetical protein